MKTLTGIHILKNCKKMSCSTGSGGTKGPADHAVWWGATLGGANSLFECGKILKT